VALPADSSRTLGICGSGSFSPVVDPSIFHVIFLSLPYFRPLFFGNPLRIPFFSSRLPCSSGHSPCDLPACPFEKSACSLPLLFPMFFPFAFFPYLGFSFSLGLIPPIGFPAPIPFFLPIFTGLSQHEFFCTKLTILFSPRILM